MHRCKSVYSTILCLLCILFFAHTSVAAFTVDKGPVRFPRRDPGIRSLFMHDANNIRATISNWGEYGNPDGVPGYFGFEFPRGSENDFLFSAGIWVGAIVGEDRLVSTGTDGDNGTNEFAPSWDRFIYQSNVFNQPPYIFSLIGIDEDDDWNHETDDLDENGEPSLDWDGPDEDANGDGIFFYDPEPHIDEDPPGDISNDLIDNDHDGLVDGADDDFDGDEARGSDDDDGDGEADEDGAAMAAQHITAFYDDTDVGEVQNADADGHTPLDIMIEQRSYSWNIIDPHVMDAVVFEATIRNIGEETLENVCFGLFSDPDVAARGEGDDPASVDDWNFYDANYLMAVHGDDTTDADGDGPGLFAIKILSTPRPLDELNVTFRNFDRVAGGDPETNADKYAMISSDIIDPPTQDLGDWRFLIGFSADPDDDPWELEPQETLEIAYALIGAEDVDAVRETAAALQEFYDEGREDIFQGNYIPFPANPNAADVGDGESILVSWPNYAQLPRFGGVNLYYGDFGDVEEVIDVELENERLLTDLEEGALYYFAISIYDEDGEESPISDSTRIRPLTVPRKPRGLSVSDEGYHQIHLTWLPNIELDLAGYNLYRSARGGRFERLNREPLEVIRYTDRMDEFAIYTYRLTALDEDGNESVPYGLDTLDVPAIGAPFILQDWHMLLVDETRNGNGNPGSPDDRQADDFYHAVLQDWEYGELDYDDFSNENNRPLSSREIGLYRTIIWHGDDKSNQNLDYESPTLDEFLSYGGKLIISGWDVLGTFTGLDEVDFEEESFPHSRLDITSGRRAREKEFVVAEGLNGYPDLILDRNKILENWAGLDRCWAMEPGEGEIIYNFVAASDTSSFDGAPCAVRHITEEGGTIVLGFPLYFMQEQGAIEFIQRALEDLEVGIEDKDIALQPLEYRLEANYPNPFNASTVITYTLPVPSHVRLAVYDMQGREISTLLNQNVAAGTQRFYAKLPELSSGIYVYAIQFNRDIRIARKMVLIK